jgi:hypothetical protein
MANNRMYLVCNVCNDFFSFAKTMGDGWYTKQNTTDDLNDFFDKHDHDHKLEDGTGSKQFTYVTEIDPKVKLYDFVNHKILLEVNDTR